MTTTARSKTENTARSKTEKSEPFALPKVPANLSEVTNGDEARAWFEDRVVRKVRATGYCAQALRVMDGVFGGPNPEHLVYDTNGTYADVGGSRATRKLYPAYIDSDGVDCWGDQWRDLETAMDRNGFDKDGRDAEGYGKDGFGADGFNREGVDRDGVSRDDPARYRFDANGRDIEGYDNAGYDEAGYNRDGLDRSGLSRPQPKPDRFVFDVHGRDREGYDVHGYRADGSFSDAVYRKYRSRNFR